MRVLLVDDAKFARLILSNMVRECGHEVVGEAANGQEAVRLYQLYKPDLVVMDIIMPLMNGIEATRKIKQLDPSACIVMASSMGQKEIVIDAVKSGAVDFIVKPFKKDKVKEVLSKLEDNIKIA